MVSTSRLAALSASLEEEIAALFGSEQTAELKRAKQAIDTFALPKKVPSHFVLPISDFVE